MGKGKVTGLGRKQGGEKTIIGLRKKNSNFIYMFLIKRLSFMYMSLQSWILFKKIKVCI